MSAQNVWSSQISSINHSNVLYVIIIIVSKMTSHCTGTVQMREGSESGIRKWEEMWFKMTAEDGEREEAAVTCDGRQENSDRKCIQPMKTSPSDTDEQWKTVLKTFAPTRQRITRQTAIRDQFLLQKWKLLVNSSRCPSSLPDTMPT